MNHEKMKKKNIYIYIVFGGGGINKECLNYMVNFQGFSPNNASFGLYNDPEE